MKFHGVNRNTQDTDIWLASNNINRDIFCTSLLDLGCSEKEISSIKDEDFTNVFKLTIGAAPDTIDCLTIVHHN